MKAVARATAERLLSALKASGALVVETDILQPADTLLDLYGEDIRARAFVTQDPLRGEMMLRPDFTVPVVQAHMRQGAEPARYCYMGEVFRKQDHADSARTAEYFQVGYEVFDRAAPEAADAEVFALFAGLLAPLKLDATIGDIGLLTAAVAALDTLPARKAALMRHIWRPKRFHALLERYGAAQAARDTAPCDAPWIGLRTEAERAERLARLQAEAEAAPLDQADVARLDALFALECPANEAPERLRALSLPEAAVARFETRLAALAAKGIALETLTFDASHGRATMEYYDGFVFSFTRDTLPPVASGGRYDALTRVLGQGREIPAVGGVIRPALVAELEARAC